MVRIGRAGPRAAVAFGVVLVWSVASACGAPSPSARPVPSTTAIDGIPLPGSALWPAPPATPAACAGVGLDAILHGDPTDPTFTWLVDRAGGGRSEVIWPVGFRARFEPKLVVVDPSGLLVNREGDPIDGGCVVGDRILLGYP